MKKRERYFRNFNEAPALMTVEETAILLNLTYEGVKSRIEHGQLPGAFRSGKRWMIDKEVLIASFGTRPPTETTAPAAEAAELTKAVRALLDALSRASA